MTLLKECEVLVVRRLEGEGKLKAFIDIRIGGALIIRGCTVVDGRNGIFAALPRRITRDGHWLDVISVSDNLRNQYEKVMLNAFLEDDTCEPMTQTVSCSEG